jgi:hypothetical protein
MGVIPFSALRGVIGDDGGQPFVSVKEGLVEHPDGLHPDAL